MNVEPFCCEAVRDGLMIKLNEPVHCVKEELTKFVLNFFELESVVTTTQLFETILCEIPISTVVLTKETINDWIFTLNQQKREVEKRKIVSLNIMNPPSKKSNREAIPA